MSSEINWALLAKYLANEQSEEEGRLVENWLDADPLNREQFSSIESTWKASSDKTVQWDVDRAWAGVASKLSLEGGVRQKSKESISYQYVERKRYLPAVKLLGTAVIIIIISVSAFLYNDVNKKPAKVSGMKKAIAIHEVTTEKGQRASFKLSDGTEVFLNSASTIKFPEKFSKSKRLVYLEGEAFFKVVHNDQKPFKVFIANGEITDIGTEFNVKAWKDDASYVVTVKEGKVSFASRDSAGRNIVYLSGKESARLTSNGKLGKPKVADVNKHISWINGRLYFENSNLNEVFKTLDRSYNFSCSVNDSSLLSLHLTATFKGDNLKEIVKIISLALDFRYKVSGNSCQFSAGKSSGLKKPSLILQSTDNNL